MNADIASDFGSPNSPNYYYIRLTAFFQDKLDKPASERKTILDFNEAREDWWHQLDHMHNICTSLQT